MSWCDTPCDEWPGYKDGNGYGIRKLVIDGKRRTVLTHREAWMEKHGPPPPDKPFVLHHCDNPPCRNVEHLFVGTQADNLADMAQKGRHHYGKRDVCSRGHEYTEANTRWRQRGKYRIRVCRACKNEDARAAYAQKAGV